MKTFTAIKELLLCHDWPMKLQWHIGDVIGKVREMRGKTRADLAQDIGLSAYSMGQIERSGKCRNTTLEKIAGALNVSVGYLYDESPNSSNDAHSDALLCSDEKHRTLHIQLERILHENSKMGDWIAGNIMTFHAALQNPPQLGGSAPEGNDVVGSAPVPALRVEVREKFANKGLRQK